MSTREIARLLEDAAAHVPPPHLAEAAWTRVVRVRRRRRIAGSVAAAVVAVALAVAVGAPPRGDQRTDPAPYPPQPAETPPPPAVDRMPARLSERFTDRLSTTVDDLARAPLLRSGVIGWADALYQAESDRKAPPEPVYVEHRGALYRLDVTLDWATSAEKELSPPLRPTSLSPDARRAAFPQADEIVVTDLTTASTLRIPVAGYNLELVWATTGSVLVGQEGATFLVDVASGRAERVPGRPSIAGLAGTGRDDGVGAAGLIELTTDDTRLALREWSVTEALPRRELPIDQRGVRPYVVTGWSGPAWRSGSLVVRAGTARSDAPAATSAATPVVAVVDVHTGVVRRLLALDGRRAGCCVPLGWHDPYTVVLRIDPVGLVVWNTRDGAVVSIAPPFPGTVALGPS